MKGIILAGCAVFIDSNFVYYMLKKYEDILLFNLDKLTYAGNLENLKGVEGDSRHVDGSITNPEILCRPMLWVRSICSIEQKRLGVSWRQKRGKQERNTCRFLHMKYMAHLAQRATSSRHHCFLRTAPILPPKASADHFVMAFHDTYMEGPSTLPAAPLTTAHVSSRRS